MVLADLPETDFLAEGGFEAVRDELSVAAASFFLLLDDIVAG